MSHLFQKQKFREPAGSRITPINSLIFFRWGNRATVVAGSAGQEFVDNIFYNYLNDYELMTLNSSIWDVWKSPINAKYNYW